MGKHSDKTRKRKHRSRSSSSDSASRSRSRRRSSSSSSKKHKKAYKYESTSSESDSCTSSSTDTSSSDSSSSSQQHRSRHSHKKKHQKKRSKSRKSSSKKKKKSKEKKKKKKAKPARECEVIGPVPEASLPGKNMKKDKSDESAGRRMLKPMTKAQWEAEQSVIRHVYDPQSGRTRLVKGDGEILEEIVSRDRHMEINKQSNVGDGVYYQMQAGILKQ